MGFPFKDLLFYNFISWPRKQKCCHTQGQNKVREQIRLVLDMFHQCLKFSSFVPQNFYYNHIVNIQIIKQIVYPPWGVHPRPLVL